MINGSKNNNKINAQSRLEFNPSDFCTNQASSNGSEIFNISAGDLKRLIDANPVDGFKRLSIILTSDKRPACDLISLYLEHEDTIKQFGDEFAYNPKDQIRRCLNQDPAISYRYSVNLLDNGKYAEAFDISSRGCERKSYSSCAVSGFILYYKLLGKNVETAKALREANKFLKVGVENFDGNSTMLHLSFNRPSIAKTDLFALFRMSPDEAKAIESQLGESGFSGMPIVEADSCLATKLIGSCRSYCKPAEIYIKKSSTEKFHRIFGDRVVRPSRCK